MNFQAVQFFDDKLINNVCMFHSYHNGMHWQKEKSSSSEDRDPRVSAYDDRDPRVSVYENRDPMAVLLNLGSIEPRSAARYFEQ